MNSEPDHQLVAELLRVGMQNGQMPFLTITSNSMSPLLKRGDQVGIIEANLGTIRPGDVVVVNAGATFVTHRLWKRSDNYLVTKGDRSLAYDPPWPASALVGLVEGRRRGKLLSLRAGRGAWVSRRLWQLARLEVWLFSGFTSNGLYARSESTQRSHRLRQDRRYRPVWFIRRAMYAVAKLLAVIVVDAAPEEGSDSDMRPEQVSAEV